MSLLVATEVHLTMPSAEVTEQVARYAGQHSLKGRAEITEFESTRFSARWPAGQWIYMNVAMLRSIVECRPMARVSPREQLRPVVAEARQEALL